MKVFDYTIISITLLFLLLLFYSVCVYTRNILERQLDDKKINHESEDKDFVEIDDLENILRKIVKDEMANLIDDFTKDMDKSFYTEKIDYEQLLHNNTKRSYSKVPKTNLSLIVDNTKFKEAI